MTKARTVFLALILGGSASPAQDGSSPARMTELGRLAASMAPATWAELKTFKMVETVVSDGASGSLFTYSEDGAWDPATRQFLYIGGDHNGIAEFVSYSADTNTWKRLPRPSWIGTTKGTHTMHGYDHNAINPATGDFYHRPFGGKTIWKCRISTGTWAALPAIATDDYLACAMGVEYFPELGGLVVVNGAGGKGSVYLFSEKDQKWTTLARNLPMGTYHNFAEYSPPQKVMIFGGGNENPTALYKLDAAGKVSPLKNAPVGLGIMQSIVTVDPVSGDFLVFGSGGTFHVYDGAADSWKLQSGPVPIFSPAKDNKIHQIDATPISSYGVTLFAKFFPGSPPQAWVYLYKHSRKSKS